jgi:hypothetical protein
MNRECVRLRQAYGGTSRELKHKRTADESAAPSLWRDRQQIDADKGTGIERLAI